MKLKKSVKRKGRPKGRDQTVIGLPKRQKRDGPVKFLTKLPVERELGTVLFTVFIVICMFKNINIAMVCYFLRPGYKCNIWHLCLVYFKVFAECIEMSSVLVNISQNCYLKVLTIHTISLL